jgi:hypothetical protein
MLSLFLLTILECEEMGHSIANAVPIKLILKIKPPSPFFRSKILRCGMAEARITKHESPSL